MEKTYHQIKTERKDVFENRSTIEYDTYQMGEYKICFCCQRSNKKKWTMPIRNWGVVLNQLGVSCKLNLQLSNHLN